MRIFASAVVGISAGCAAAYSIFALFQPVIVALQQVVLH